MYPMIPSVDAIIKFEDGELDITETIELFAGMIKSGLVWSLQGSYGRTASDLINAGYIDEKGNILETDI